VRTCERANVSDSLIRFLAFSLSRFFAFSLSRFLADSLFRQFAEEITYALRITHYALLI